nr:UDP-glycosyltransferase [Nicotiana tabacum]
MLKLAKILHHKGFHITFVNTDFNHRRLLKSHGPDSLKDISSFHHSYVLPPCNSDATQDIPYLCESTNTTCLGPFTDLLAKLNDTNTSNTTLDWIPAMKDVRLRDLPSFLRTTNPDEFMIKFVFQETERARKASAIILNTFETLEAEVLESLRNLLPPVYSIGPLHLLVKHVDDEKLKGLGSSLWKEEPECIQWLDTKEPNSVVYVNFGSITVMTPNQLIEFAWGLANSQQIFLWIIRPDIVAGDTAILPPEFVEETKNRGMLASWCPQEEVLSHSAIGGFLTHGGWNSTLQSISSGVPMICWPFFAEQQTNCWFSVTKWDVGMEIDNNVKRDEVESLVRELMVGDKGKKLKEKAMEWKKLAEIAATKHSGSSYVNIEKVVNDILLPTNHEVKEVN